MSSISIESQSVELFFNNIPLVVLKQILDFIPWMDRIKYERVSRQFFNLLRPKRLCRLPLDSRIRVDIQQPHDVEQRKCTIQMRSRWSNELVQISVRSYNNEQLIEEMDRMLTQVPTLHVEFTRLPCLEQNFFTILTFRANRISKLWLSFSSIQGLSYDRQFWNSIWRKLPRLLEVEIYSLKTDARCNMDDLLIDLIESRSLEKLIVNYCEPSITDKTLIQLSKNCCKLSLIECIDAPEITNQGVETVTKSLLLAPVSNGGRPRMNFWRCTIDKENFLFTFGETMDPVTWKANGEIVKINPDSNQIEGFANDKLFVCFDRQS